MDNLDMKLDLDFIWELTEEERSRLETILNLRIQKFREDLSIQRVRSNWVCNVCKKSTWETDYDYLLAANLHLGCAIGNSTDEKLKQLQERNSEILHYD
tara:strand:- start:3619 stop:3915 length:297 start_codon:yes stop_codon:yes gene_type:complete